MQVAASNLAAASVAVLLSALGTCLLPKGAWADVLVCGNAHVGKTEAHVVVPHSARDTFITYVKRGFPDKHYGLKSTGGAEASVRLTMDLNDFTSGNIAVIVENRKPRTEFVFWIQTCNTTRSWQPFWGNVMRSTKAFPGAKVWEKPFTSQ